MVKYKVIKVLMFTDLWA